MKNLTVIQDGEIQGAFGESKQDTCLLQFIDAAEFSANYFANKFPSLDSVSDGDFVGAMINVISLVRSTNI